MSSLSLNVALITCSSLTVFFFQLQPELDVFSTGVGACAAAAAAAGVTESKEAAEEAEVLLRMEVRLGGCCS